jgi:hypothetical protein
VSPSPSPSITPAPSSVASCLSNSNIRRHDGTSTHCTPAAPSQGPCSPASVLRRTLLSSLQRLQHLHQQLLQQLRPPALHAALLRLQYRLPHCLPHWEIHCFSLTQVEDKLPMNPYYEYYGPDHRLHIQPSNMENQNTPEYLDKVSLPFTLRPDGQCGAVGSPACKLAAFSTSLSLAPAQTLTFVLRIAYFSLLRCVQSCWRCCRRSRRRPCRWAASVPPTPWTRTRCVSPPCLTTPHCVSPLCLTPCVSHCVSTLCLHTVSPHCVSTLCLHTVSHHCVSTLCLHTVSPHCVSTLCLPRRRRSSTRTSGVSHHCVSTLCLHTVSHYCVSTLCLHTVSHYCVSTLCLHTVSPHCVSTLCLHTVSHHCVSPLCLHTVSPHCVSLLCLHTVSPQEEEEQHPDERPRPRGAPPGEPGYGR